MSLTTDLISYYQCEDFTDSYGSNNGSAYSISIVAGLFGNCWEYSSDSDRVSVGPTPDVGTWTVAGWAALLDTGGWRAFANNNQSGTNGAYHMILNTSGEIGVWSNSTFAGSGVTLNPADYQGWHHYAATRDSLGVVRFYVDGSYIGQCTPTWTGSHRVNVIGNTIGSERFAEKIDDYAIWNRALTAAEIASIYTAGNAGNSLHTLIFSISTSIKNLWTLDTDGTDLISGNTATVAGGTVNFVSGAGRNYAEYVLGEQSSTTTTDLSGGKLTLSFWAEAGTPYTYFGNTYNSFITFGKSGQYFSLYLLNGKIRAYHTSSGGSSDNRGTVNVPSGWNHYAITFNSTTNAKVVYLNGVAQSLTGGGYSGTFSSAQTTFLGNISSSSAFRQNGGGLDDVGLWSRDLSASEILQIYNAGTAGISSLIPLNATLRGMWATVTHSVAAEDATLHGMWATVTHSVAAEDATLHGMWMSVVHNDVEAPTGGGSLNPFQGDNFQPTLTLNIQGS